MPHKLFGRSAFAAIGGVLVFAFVLTTFCTSYSSGRAEPAEDTIVDVYNWNSAGSELDGFNALVAVYTSTYPDTSILSLNDYEELADRITSGNPPDSFEFHCGSQLIYTWVEPGDYIEPITELWSDQGWMEKVPQGLIDMITYQGELFCVPLNIHRGNVLWYNKNVFTDNGLTPPTTFTEFFAVAEALETAGKIPLAVGDSGTWADIHLLETVLLGSLGPEKYRGLWNGSVAFDSPDVITALETFTQMMNYVNPDHAARDWSETISLVGNGEAGMTIMGDWAEMLFQDMGLEPDVDYGWVPVPGSAGSFMVITDSFVMPRNAPHPQEATNWLKTVGSIEGQDTFSPYKSSIPARLDADASLYGVYHKSALIDYASNELTPSLIHGLAAPPSFVEATDPILQDLIVFGDAAAAASALHAAAVDAGFGIRPLFLPYALK